MERVLWDLLRDLLRERAEDGLLRTSILDFKPKLANRCRVFPVSAIFHASILDFRARLANRCKLFPDYTLLRASILDFKPKLANRCSTIVVAVENGPPAAVVAATNSASDSVLRCSKGKWLACYGRSGNDLPRPILFFVAAKKNGPPATPSLLHGRTASL